MAAQDRATVLHEAAQESTARARRQMSRDRAIGNVVRRLSPGLIREKSRPVSPVDEQVAITYTGMKFERAIRAGVEPVCGAPKLLLNRFDTCSPVSVMDVPGGEVSL